ncbi:MAG: hypothetical protein ABIF40_03815 [archaeon]
MKAKLILVILIASLVFFLTLDTPNHEIGMYLTVANYTGFNVDNDALYFGAITPAGIGTRMVNITNSNQISYVNLKAKGKLKHWVVLPENNFVMMPNENKIVEVSISVPESAAYGEYEGKLQINFKNG